MSDTTKKVFKPKVVSSTPVRGEAPQLAVVDPVYAEESLRRMDADLAKSGLEAGDMDAFIDTYRPAAVDVAAIGSYVLPYYDLKGNPLRPLNDMMRRRLFYNVSQAEQERDKGRYPRYKQPPNSALANKAHMGIPYLHPWLHEAKVISATMDLCEGEKKTVAFMKFAQRPAIGIPGCWSWMVRDEDGRIVIHPWILWALTTYKIKVVRLWPDGDYRRLHINAAYGMLARLLEDAGYTVLLMDTTAIGKIDDYLVAGGKLKGIQGRSVHELAYTARELIDRYGLMEGARGGVVDNEHNLMELFKYHPMFKGQFWWNSDRERVYIGPTEMDHDMDKVVVTDVLQRQFAMSRVSSAKVEQCIVAMARQNKRSPLDKWLRQLAWDKVPRLDTWLADYHGAIDTAHVRETGRKFFIAAVARALQPGCMVDYMMCLIGPQGIGKSGGLRLLFGEENVSELPAYTKDKDFALLRSSVWVIEDPELDHYTRTDANMKKQDITIRVDSVRPPYGRHTEHRPRRSIYVGTGNRKQFLRHDSTGQRRFAVVEVGQVDFAGLSAVREQLFAEAVWRYEKGEKYSNISTASTTAKQYERENEWQAYVEDVVAEISHMPSHDKSYKGVNYKWLKVADVKKLVRLKFGKDLYDEDIRDSLRDMGFKRYEQVRIAGRVTDNVWMRANVGAVGL